MSDSQIVEQVVATEFDDARQAIAAMMEVGDEPAAVAWLLEQRA